MGADKAALEFDGQGLLDRAVLLLRSLLADVYVSVNKAQTADVLRTSYPVIVDELDNIGPAAGMLAAHGAFPDSAWLVVACDMPLLDADTLAKLVAGRDPDGDATAMAGLSSRRPEPLCAIYEPATLAAFRRQVSDGLLAGPSALLATSRVKLCEVPEGLLVSANTREELAGIRDRLEKRGRIADGK